MTKPVDFQNEIASVFARVRRLHGINLTLLASHFTVIWNHLYVAAARCCESAIILSSLCVYVVVGYI